MDLWGKELVEEIRRRFPNPEDLPSAEDCETLYNLLELRGCELPRITRGRPVKNLIEDLVEGQDPIYTGGKETAASGPVSPQRTSPGPIIPPLEEKPHLSEVEKLRAELELERFKLQQAAQEEEIRKLREEIKALRRKREEIESSSSHLSDEDSDEPKEPVALESPMVLGRSIKLLTTLIPPVERFGGQDDRSIVEDLLIFEGLCKANRVPFNQWAQILVYVLKADARRFFRSQPISFQNDYKRIKQALIDRYLSPEKMDRIKMQYNDLSLKDCGSLEKYGEELLRLYKYLPEGYATEAALIDRLILGIGQEEVTRQYRTVRPKTYSAAMELVRVWAKPPRKSDRLLQTVPKSPKKKPVKLPTKGKPQKTLSVPKTSPRSVICHKCGKPGHYANRCLQPRIPRCGLCGLTGHITRQCPSLPEDLKAKFNGLYSQNNPMTKEVTPPRPNTTFSESTSPASNKPEDNSKN